MRLPPAPGDCPAVTAVQMVDVDRRAVACFDLSLVQTALGVPYACPGDEDQPR